MFDSLPDFDNGHDDCARFPSGDPFSDVRPAGASNWENLIRDAGDYVRPGDQLRGRILDAVSTRRRRRRGWRRSLAAITLATSAVLVLILLGNLMVTFVPHGRSASELHEQANVRAGAQGVAWEWALTDVLYDWRRKGTSFDDSAAFPHGGTQ